MASRKLPRGVCGFCGRESTKGGLTRHLASCGARKDAIQAADAGSGRAESLIHLRVQDDSRSEFWLDLEISGSAPLRDLDRYLRAIWLDCCGHLSMFSQGGWGAGDELPKSARIDRALRPGSELVHIYDFGTSSETLIKSVSAREGKPTGGDRPIALMSRNLPPAYGYAECDRPAARACAGCVEFDDVSPGALCDSHAEAHACDYTEFTEEPPAPLANSPRVGMCAYDGPAEPPY